MNYNAAAVEASKGMRVRRPVFAPGDCLTLGPTGTFYWTAGGHVSGRAELADDDLRAADWEVAPMPMGAVATSLHQHCQSKSWFVTVGIDERESALILYVTKHPPASQFAKDHWYGYKVSVRLTEKPTVELPTGKDQ